MPRRLGPRSRVRAPSNVRAGGEHLTQWLIGNRSPAPANVTMVTSPQVSANIVAQPPPAYQAQPLQETRPCVVIMTEG